MKAGPNLLGLQPRRPGPLRLLLAQQILGRPGLIPPLRRHLRRRTERLPRSERHPGLHPGPLRRPSTSLSPALSFSALIRSTATSSPMRRSGRVTRNSSVTFAARVSPSSSGSNNHHIFPASSWPATSTSNRSAHSGLRLNPDAILTDYNTNYGAKGPRQIPHQSAAFSVRHRNTSSRRSA